MIEFFPRYKKHNFLLDEAPVVSAIKKIPEWFNNVPREEPTRQGLTKLIDKLGYQGTIKKCPSYVDWFRSGFTIPMWCDLAIETELEPGTQSYRYRYRFSGNSDFALGEHKDEQYRDYIPQTEKDKQKLILKFINPWCCKTSKGYSVYQMPMFYHYDDRFTVLPGIINTDYHHTLNLQIAIHKEGEFIIKKGTPLVTYIPFKRESLKLQLNEATDKSETMLEKKQFSLLSQFGSWYKKKFFK